jgi:hypothetical protein
MGLPAEVEGYAFWWVPELGANVGGMDAVVFDPPQGLSLLTLYLATRTEPGQVGNILIEVLKGYDIVASFQLTVPGGMTGCSTPSTSFSRRYRRRKIGSR